MGGCLRAIVPDIQVDLETTRWHFILDLRLKKWFILLVNPTLELYCSEKLYLFIVSRYGTRPLKLEGTFQTHGYLLQ